MKRQAQKQQQNTPANYPYATGDPQPAQNNRAEKEPEEKFPAAVELVQPTPGYVPQIENIQYKFRRNYQKVPTFTDIDGNAADRYRRNHNRPGGDIGTRQYPENEAMNGSAQKIGTGLEALKKNAHLLYGFFENNINDLRHFIDNNAADYYDWADMVDFTRNMFYDWKYGTGDEKRSFNNDRIALSMKDAPGVEVVRDIVYQGLKRMNNPIEYSLKNEPAPFNPVFAGFDPIEQFVGRCTADVDCYDGKNLHFKLWNNTSAESYYYHKTAGENYFRRHFGWPEKKEMQWTRDTYPPKSNMRQTYEWDEPIDFSRLKQLNPE